MREPIKTYTGKVLGYIETRSNGDKVATTFTGKILGYYRANIDATTDFTGTVLSRGDITSSLIYMHQGELWLT